MYHMIFFFYCWHNLTFNMSINVLFFQSKLHSSAPRSSEDEEAMEVLEDENRALKSQLEEAKRGATRLSKERDELTQRLEERDLEREVLKRGKSDLEEQKRLLDRALEKINKEVHPFFPPSFVMYKLLLRQRRVSACVRWR